MITKLFTFDKRKESSDQFEARMSGVVAGLGEVTGVKSFETQAGDVVFQLDVSGKPCEQEFCFLAWLDLDNAEGIINGTLSNVSASGKKVKHVNIVAIGKSARVVAAIIVEAGGSDEISGSEEQKKQQAQGQADKQDQDVDAKPKRGRQRKA